LLVVLVAVAIFAPLVLILPEFFGSGR
jgi:hypothetical protein